MIKHINTKGVPYTGNNETLLHLISVQRQYKSTKWGTYNQWKELGRVPKGSGIGVQLIRLQEGFKLNSDDGNGENLISNFITSKKFTVFNEDTTQKIVDNETSVE